MGFGILAGSFSRGLNNGINAANSVKDKEEKIKRQGILDERYQHQLDRQNASDERQKKTFDQSQEDRAYNKDVRSTLNLLTNAKGKTILEKASSLFNMEGQGDYFKNGAKNIKLHPYQDENGQTMFAVTGQVDGSNEDNVMDQNGFVPLERQVDYQGLNRMQLLALGAHHLGKSPEVLNEAFAQWSEKASKLTKRQELGIKQSNAIKLQTLKSKQAGEKGKNDRLKALKQKDYTNASWKSYKKSGNENDLVAYRSSKTPSSKLLEMAQEQAASEANEKASVWNFDSTDFPEGRHGWMNNRANEIYKQWMQQGNSGDEINSSDLGIAPIQQSDGSQFDSMWGN